MKVKVKMKGKENVWSVDNEVANSDRERVGKKRGKKRVKKKRSQGDRVLVSGPMLMEVETVLQTQVLFSSLLNGRTVWKICLILFG